MTPHPYGWLSLLPPIVAIILAIATRRIVLSLIAGIFAGALLMAGGNPLMAIYQTWETHLWQTLIDPGKLRVFSFTLLMGMMIGVITVSGGMQGLIRVVEPWASDRRWGQLATWFTGLLIFFDDYANTLLLGNTLRPVCDRLKISREKLAYVVDSTAAPVAGLAPLSTWVAVEIDYIGNGLEAIGDDGLSAFGIFLASIPYRFYIWTALLLVPITAWLGRDIGPMVAAERRAMEGSNDELDEVVADTDANQTIVANWAYAVLPIALTLSLVVFFIYDTGARGVAGGIGADAIDAAKTLVQDNEAVASAIASVDELAGTARLSALQTSIGELATAVEAVQSISEEQKPVFERDVLLRDILGEADSSLALQYGALAGLCLAVLMPLVTRAVPLDKLLTGAASGAKVVLPAVAILWTASAMSRMTTDSAVDGRESDAPFAFRDHRLYTADYLTKLVAGGEVSGDADTSTDSEEMSAARIPIAWFPTTVFVLAGVVAFCTGTSWGTMGILLPMVVQMVHALLAAGGDAVSANDPILLCSVGGVLAGAVFGDHCSPISDTTVLSSQSSGCDHLAHVWTQMPYAVLAASASILLGTLPLGYGVSVWLLLPLQLLTLFGFMRLFGSRTGA